MKYQLGVSLLALAVSGACGGAGGDVTSAISPNQAAQASRSESGDHQSPARRGALVVKKDCTGYAGQAGGTCTITESTLEALNGATITYASAAVNGVLNSDIIVAPPGRGNGVVYGHCTVNLATGLGECTLSGGTGKFKHLRARVDVTPLGWPFFAWRGTYSFGKADQDDEGDEGDDR